MKDDISKNDRVINIILLKRLPFLLSYFSNNIDLCAAYFYRYIVLNDEESYALFNNLYCELTGIDKKKVIDRFKEWKNILISKKTQKLIKINKL